MFQTTIHNVPTFVIDLLRLCAWLAILTAIFVPLERLFALHPSRIWRKGIGADLGYYFFSGIVASTLLSLPLGALAWAIHAFMPAFARTAFSGTSFVVRALLALIAGEIGYYWGHRLMHTVPLLWRFHAIHHSPRHIDFLVNSRAHPIDLAFGRMCTYVPLYVLSLAQPVGGAGMMLPIIVSLGGRIWSFFIHANMRWRLGPLEWVISSPRFHHWHHAMEPANRNYASLLPVLDWLFGSFHLPKSQWPPGYGIQGVVPDSWAGQLLRPLLGSFPLARAEAMAIAPPPAEVSH